MNDTHPQAIPTFAELSADPEIAPLLTFTPVPRKVDRHNGWKPEAQREFIALLAWFGIPSLAAKAIDKNLSGVTALYKLPHAGSFRAAWDAARDLGIRRTRADRPVMPLTDVPGVPSRYSSQGPAQRAEGLPGQVMNERGEWEDEAAMLARADDARDSIAGKLLRIRRMYLQEISDSPGKRAAFEILTELPIDWDRAARGEAQADEPHRTASQREPDMVLLAESGWSFGEIGYGPDRKAVARRAIDRYRLENGLPPIDWESGSADG